MLPQTAQSTAPHADAPPLDRWQLTDDGAESYERFQVPSVFDPLARVFLSRVGLEPGQRVLDVACGTGILARHVAPQIGAAGRMVGVDLNPGMLQVARRAAPPTGAPTEWRLGDAGALPSRNAAFDLVLCQQGLQFFPDRPRALREMHRVLVPGGQLALCVWNGLKHSPCNQAVTDAVARHQGPAAAARIQAPFALGDPEKLRKLIEDAGFVDVVVRQAAVIRMMLPAAQSIPGHLASTPVGPDVAALAPAARDRLVAEISAALRPYEHPAGLAIPQGTLIATARKPKEKVMQRYKNAMILAVAGALVSASPLALAKSRTEHAGPEEVVAKVRKAAAYLAKHGPAGLKRLRDPKSEFTWKDTYVFVVNCDADKVLSNPAFPKRQGGDIKQHTDYNGKRYGLALCATAKQPGGGWVEYVWPRPGGGKPMRKVSFVMSVKGYPYQVGAGIYNRTVSLKSLGKLVDARR